MKDNPKIEDDDYDPDNEGDDPNDDEDGESLDSEEEVDKGKNEGGEPLKDNKREEDKNFITACLKARDSYYDKDCILAQIRGSLLKLPHGKMPTTKEIFASKIFQLCTPSG